MAITASGLGSGLDVDGLVSQLVAAERATTDNRLNKNEILLQAKLSAFGSLKGALATFQSSLSGLQESSTFDARKATVSNNEILTVTAGSEATTGSYSVEVSQLAKAHSLASGVYSATTEVVGEGEITFRFGTTDYDSGTDTYNSFALNSSKAEAKITIDSSNNTLEGIRTAINSADIGVTASIINDGTGYRLLLSSADTGAENSLEVSVTESGAAGLGQLAFNAGATNLTETIAGQDALLTINGLAVSSASNTVSGAIEDVGITLLSTTSGVPINISIDRDRASVKNAIDGFISSYNSFIETVNQLSSFNPETLQAGILLGDSTLRGVTSKVQEVLGAAIGGSAALQRLTDIGITTGEDGTLSMDTAVLDEVLDNDFDAIAGLFTASGTTTDALVNFVSSTQKTQPGTYGVVISQLATQAELQGAGVLPDFGISTLTIDSDNDTLTLKVDGTTSGEITLTAGVYTSGIDLAAEIEAKINADSALAGAGAVVTVTYDVTGNQFVINSTSYGSESTVEITQSDATSGATLGLSVGAGVSGVDVAGTIGGSKATGLGQSLTGAAGSDTEGLVLDISGGGIGTRGSVAFNRGVAEKLEDLLNVYLGAESLVDLRTDSLSDQIEDIGERRDSLNLRMESFESRTRARFTALDTLLAQLLQTSDFLAQQLTNLPGAISNKK